MTESSITFGLYLASATRACCFCQRKIEKGAKAWGTEIDQRQRFAHLECMHNTLVEVIKIRDVKGKSEDLKGCEAIAGT